MKTRLAAIEYEELLTSVDEIYACSSLEEFPVRVIKVIRKLIPSVSASYNEVNVRQKRMILEMDPPLPKSNLPHIANLEQLFQQHPMITYAHDTGDGQALKISDFLSARDYHRLDLYQQVYRNMATEDQLSIGVQAEDGFVLGIAVNRTTRTFTEKDRLRMNLLRPHIIRAYLMAQERHGFIEQLADLKKAMGEVGCGVIGLDSAGDVIHATPGAFDCLARYVPIPEPMGARLPARVARWAQGDADSPDSMTLENDSAQVTLRRIRRSDRTLLVVSENSRVMPTEHLVPYKLTRRELDVLRWLAEGKSNAEIASILGISPATVKNHAERLFAKLGVSNRTQAAILLRKLK
jgi:DNA-binding CsgD family transcriptional regulator